MQDATKRYVILLLRQVSNRNVFFSRR